MEYWDLYDETRRPLGRTMARGDALGPGEYHLIVNVWVVNSEGKVLVTQRHPDKHWGGYWECSGGGVMTGESSREAAARELAEEVGIRVDPGELEFQVSVTRPGHDGYANGIWDVYLVRRDVAIADLVLQAEEVVDAKWVSPGELRQMEEAGAFFPFLHNRFGFWENL